MRSIIVHPFAAAAGVLAAGFALISAFPVREARAIPNLACNVVPAQAIARAAGRPVRLAPTGGDVCRYLGTESALEVIATVVPAAPNLPFGANAALVDLPGGRVFVVRVRDEDPRAEPERLAATIADLAAEGTATTP